MLIARNVGLFGLFVLLINAALARSQTLPPTADVLTCGQETLARPGIGVAYRGEVANDDYKFVADIPKGLTGWGGVAPDAPFHGFTIFLDQSMQSCIDFDVHIRVDVDVPEMPSRPNSAKVFSLGKAKAWQVSKNGSTKSATFTNITTYFTFEHDDGEIDDGDILLISPSADLKSAAPVYESFLKSIHFGSYWSRCSCPK